MSRHRRRWLALIIACGLAALACILPAQALAAPAQR